MKPIKWESLGKTKHCFIGASGRPISLKREFPELDAKLKEYR